MTSKIEILVAELASLSTDDLLSLQEQIISQLRQRRELYRPDFDAEEEDEIKYSTPEEDENELIQLFGAERYAEIKRELANGALDKLPPTPKSLSQYIIEDRG